MGAEWKKKKSEEKRREKGMLETNGLCVGGVKGKAAGSGPRLIARSPGQYWAWSRPGSDLGLLEMNTKLARNVTICVGFGLLFGPTNGRTALHAAITILSPRTSASVCALCSPVPLAP